MSARGTKKRDSKALLRFSSGQHKGELIPCAANVTTILATDEAWKDVLAFDEFEGTATKLTTPPWYEVDSPAEANRKPGAWTDTDTTRLRAWLAREYDLVVSTTEAHEAINAAAESHVLHPVRDYLLSHTWNRTARLDTWLIDFCGAEDTPLVRAVGAAWMIAAVARVMRPGVKADCMLVLQGPQGGGKSSALGALVPNEDWFSDEFDADTKDGKIALRGVWIVEVAELAALKRSEVESIKAFLSRRVDKYRNPYGRRDGRHPRQCVLAGTTNAEEFLKDDTGNRRFWPVRVGKIDVAGLRATRDQLWAEAVARFEMGEAWHLIDSRIIDSANEQQETRLVSDPREEIVAQWLASKTTQRPRRESGVTTKEVLIDALCMPPDRAGKPAEMEAATLLRKCGWSTCGKKHTRRDARPRLYFPQEGGCIACLERWDVIPQRDKRKKVGQVGQVGHRIKIIEKSSAQPQSRQVGQVGHSSPSRIERGRKNGAARGHMGTNGKGARSRAEEHRQ